MNESTRTVVFLIVALVSVVGARFASPSAPKPAAEVTGVGEPFYPDFSDPDLAKSMEVITFVPEMSSVKKFTIAQDKSGLWRIPSALNYPADGKDRLAETATSMIGIKRDAFAGVRDKEHAEFGVLDPATSDATEGVGSRLTLKDANGQVLADYIIGHEVKGHPGMRYIRRPDAKPTYYAKLNIALTTKFTDWIEPDLLKIEGNRLNTVVIDTTSVVDGQKREVVDGETNRLSRKSSGDPWKLDGLEDAKEEPNQDEIRKLVSSLDDLKILGVRRKPERLLQGLREGEGLQLDQAGMMDLDMKGFFLVRAKKGFRLIPKNGQVIAVTDQGVAYDLKFGEVFEGTDEEVEVGFAAKDGEKKKEEIKKDLKKSRYLFVTVHFDADGLGLKPAEPAKPEETSDQPAEDEPADASAPTNTAPDPKQVYAAALAKHGQDLKNYEADQKSYQEKVKAGEKLVKELNARFAEWYYVVSGDSFENLRQGRKTLVKDKTAAAPPEGDPGNPGIPGLPPGLRLPPGFGQPPGKN